mmetsp:Transcript_135408/g.234852  ORF Transcript_135408/g.234852 Transcript_135408/m.234852 type:complete len:100 (-) Transcript_135408:228-527(-)
MPLKGKVDDVISQWDKNFLYTNLIKGGDEKQHELLIDCIFAANFLNIKDMLDLICAALASMIKGKTPEQIRTLFNIEILHKISNFDTAGILACLQNLGL